MQAVTTDLRIGGTIIRTILHHVPQSCAIICIHIVHWVNWEWVVCLGADLCTVMGDYLRYMYLKYT